MAVPRASRDLRDPDAFGAAVPLPGAAPPGPPPLSPREVEIARLAARGLSNKEIARVLEISHWTVSTHIRRLYDKLGLRRRAALASWVTATGDGIDPHGDGGDT